MSDFRIMTIWKELLEPAFSKHKDNTWLKFHCKEGDDTNSIFTFDQIYALSTIITHELVLLQPGVVGLMFSDQDFSILGYFPAVIAALR